MQVSWQAGLLRLRQPGEKDRRMMKLHLTRKAEEVLPALLQSP